MNEENPNADFLALANAYAEATGIKETAVSSRVFNDGKKLTQLREGASITSVRLNRAIQWFADNWPKGARWPKGIRRPKRLKTAALEAAP